MVPPGRPDEVAEAGRWIWAAERDHVGSNIMLWWPEEPLSCVFLKSLRIQTSRISKKPLKSSKMSHSKILARAFEPSSRNLAAPMSLPAPGCPLYPGKFCGASSRPPKHACRIDEIRFEIKGNRFEIKETHSPPCFMFGSAL